MKKIIVILLLAIAIVPAASAKVRLPKGCSIWGQVLCDGKPAQGVVVSDGAELSITDKKGFYYLESDKREGSVWVSIPSCTEVETSYGMPHFWQRLTEPIKIVQTL